MKLSFMNNYYSKDDGGNVDLSNYYTKEQIDKQQSRQDNDIAVNGVNIINVDTRICEVIRQLNNSTLINYMGEWVDGTNAKLGEVWSYQNEMWLCKVKQTSNEPDNSDDWDLISAPEINLSNYYTKSEVDSIKEEQNTQIQFNKQNIKNVEQEQEKIEEEQTTINDKLDYFDRIVKWDDGSTRILFSDDRYLKINATNAYKFVSGKNEVLASEDWVNDQFQYLQPKILKYSANVSLSPYKDNLITNIGWNNNIISINVYRKRNDGQFFYKNNDDNTQIYVSDKYVKMWVVEDDGWTNEFKVEIYYGEMR